MKLSIWEINIDPKNIRSKLKKESKLYIIR